MSNKPLDLAAHISPLFATPVARYQWPSSKTLNSQLREVILAREKTDAGDAKNIIGGWSSTKDLMQWSEPPVLQLHERLHQAAQGMLRSVLYDAPQNLRLQMEAWANVSRNGQYHGVHSHPNSAWSGVYYVSVGVPTPGYDEYNGQIELLDPRTGAESFAYPGSPFTLRARVAPQAGMLLMFPSWLKHMVHVFYGSGERISIAFNFNPLT